MTQDIVLLKKNNNIINVNCGKIIQYLKSKILLEWI